MIIECPHCGTRFRLDAGQLGDGPSMLKCARCQRVFPAPALAPAARRRARQAPADDNLSFAFDDDDEWQAPELTDQDLSEDAPALNVPPAERRQPPRPRPARPRPAGAEQPSLRFDRGDEGPADDENPAGYVDEPEAAPRAAPPTATGGISVRSVFIFLAVVVGAYGALAWSLLDDPDWARKLTQTLPLIGASLKERSAADAIALIDVQGRYERTKDGKAVFVISGRAVNHSAQSLRDVQIRAALFDGAARRLEEHVTDCGNAFEARIRELSAHQVSILRGIRPPPDTRVAPGGQCPFVSIFLDVPSSAATFSTEIARARAHA